MKNLSERIISFSTRDSDGCWNWTGYLDPQGYGKIVVDGHWHKSHRAAYTAFVGPIHDGLEIDHLCRNTRCVNPEHLEPVTREENMRRRTAAITHCRNGHLFDERNTYRYVTRQGHVLRNCRKCNLLARGRYMANKKVTA